MAGSQPNVDIAIVAAHCSILVSKLMTNVLPGEKSNRPLIRYNIFCCKEHEKKMSSIRLKKKKKKGDKVIL